MILQNSKKFKVAHIHVIFPLQVFVLDELLFTKVLPWYKEHIRGPALPFEYLEEELKSKSGWPPIGDCKNNEIKIGMQPK